MVGRDGVGSGVETDEGKVEGASRGMIIVVFRGELRKAGSISVMKLRDVDRL